MAVKPPFPRDFWQTPCGAQLTINWTSYEPVVLWLIWTLRAPVRSPRYRTLRGVPVECGFTDTLVETSAISQGNAGASLQHTFTLPALPAGTTVYYTVSTSPTYHPGQASSPVYSRQITACPPGVNYCRLATTQREQFSSGMLAYWRYLLDGNPAMDNHPLGILNKALGQFDARHAVNLYKLDGTADYRISLRWNTAILAQETVHLTKGQYYTSILRGTVNCTFLNGRFASYCENLSGSGTGYIRLNNLNELSWIAASKV